MISDPSTPGEIHDFILEKYPHVYKTFIAGMRILGKEVLTTCHLYHRFTSDELNMVEESYAQGYKKEQGLQSSL